MSVLFAGRDTTAATLSWAMYELSNYPHMWAKLRKEILNKLGPQAAPTYEVLKNLTYLKKVLNETLRLHPATPLNMRQALETTTIPGRPGEADIVLLKGDSVTINVLSMHTCVDLYPLTSEKFADLKIFSPERWEHWTPKPWTYIPFSGGPRICIGQNFALTEMAFCCELSASDTLSWSANELANRSLFLLSLVVRLAQQYERIEYRGDWAAQKLQVDLIGTPALGVPMALYKPGEVPDPSFKYHIN